jgi:hypothetical protein
MSSFLYYFIYLLLQHAYNYFSNKIRSRHSKNRLDYDTIQLHRDFLPFLTSSDTNKCTMEIYFKNLKLQVGTSTILNGINGRIKHSSVTAVIFFN